MSRGPTVALSDKSTFSVYYEDTDFTGYVYHANYLKYFERAREHMLGIAYLKQLYEQGVHFVVHHIDLTYHSPARHGDTVVVESHCGLTDSPIISIEQKAFLKTEAGDTSKPLVSAKLKIVAVNAEGKPTRRWAELRQKNL